jgi:hypothetical protein
MNNVTPRPMRRALTGVTGAGVGSGFFGVLSGLLECPDPVLPEPLLPDPVLPDPFEPELPEPEPVPVPPLEPPPSIGFLRLVFGVVLVLGGLFFGREVRNAPRTSSSS